MPKSYDISTFTFVTLSIRLIFLIWMIVMILVKKLQIGLIQISIHILGPLIRNSLILIRDVLDISIMKIICIYSIKKHTIR